MPLLDKFIEPRARERKFITARNANSSQIEDIIKNIQNILQARRTTNPTATLGLMDFCEQSLSEPLVQKLCEDIQQQIQKHEKRLDKVQVTVADNKKHGWNFLVSANLAAELNVGKVERMSFVLALAKSR